MKTVVNFKRFTRPEALRAVGRPLLLRFFERFRQSLGHELELPSADLPEDEWFGALARLFSTPEALPDTVVEALYSIDEMSAPDGQEQLACAIRQAGLAIEIQEGSTRHDIALQVWLTAPTLLARIHNQHRMRRLCVFEYFGTALSPERRPPFTAPDGRTLKQLAELLDPWFARHHRGRNTSRIELYTAPETMPDSSEPSSEYWFLVRHGDTFSRASKVEEQRTEIIHFRPQRDDVVVYSPARDEVRINSRTRGERDLYVRVFGACFRGSPDYFCARDTYTLEPLRAAGPDSLQADDIPGLDKVVLREVQVALEHGHQVVTVAGEDLFQRPGPHEHPIPTRGRLRCAAFDLHFSGCPRPRPLRIRPPNVLKIGRHCDAHVAHLWMQRRAFRR